jgi:prepilin-type N-terminal cleavage/methylation domain-containing protein
MKTFASRKQGSFATMSRTDAPTGITLASPPPRLRRGSRVGVAPRPGFTLVELIVVIIILAVMAGVIVPRTLNVGSRQADVEARAAQQLLTLAAERDTLSVEPQAIEYDDASGELRLLVRRAGTVTTLGRNDSADAWRPDPLLLPVVFTSSRLAQAWADGRPLPGSQWRVVFSPSQPRPSLTLQVEHSSDRSRSSEPGTAWQLVLAPDAAAATRLPVQAGQGFASLASARSIDLDAVGKGEKPW